MPSSPDVDRPHATVLGAFLEGWRRVLRAPALTAGILALTFLTALPLAIVLRDAIDRQLGSSLTSERLLAGWDTTWASDFASSSGQGAQGLDRTLTHEILGFGGTLAAISRFVDQQPLNPAVTGAVVVYIAAWLFLSGGILDRVARGRPVRLSAFFAACGVYFVRFLRLAVVIGACYWALFAWLHPLLFVTLYNQWTRDLTREPQGIAIRVLLYVVFLGALMAVSVIADFAKVRAVVEDRHSMISALGASIRFVRRRPWRVIGLYLVNILAVLIILRLWLQTAPAAEAPTWLALFTAQVYLLFRIWAKLAFMASEVVFFQGELAHATYTALPEPIWPDSAGVEAIGRLRKGR